MAMVRIWEDIALSIETEGVGATIKELRKQLRIMNSRSFSAGKDAAEYFLRILYGVALAFERNPSLANDKAWHQFLAFSAPRVTRNNSLFYGWYDRSVDRMEFEWRYDDGAPIEDYFDYWPSIAHAWSAYNLMRKLYADYADAVRKIGSCLPDDEFTDMFRKCTEIVGGIYVQEVPLDVPSSHWWWWYPGKAPATREERLREREAILNSHAFANSFDLTTEEGRQKLANHPERELLEGLGEMAARGELGFESEVSLIANATAHGGELPASERGAGVASGDAVGHEDLEEDEYAEDEYVYDPPNGPAGVSKMDGDAQLAAVQAMADELEFCSHGELFSNMYDQFHRFPPEEHEGSDLDVVKYLRSARRTVRECDSALSGYFDYEDGTRGLSYQRIVGERVFEARVSVDEDDFVYLQEYLDESPAPCPPEDPEPIDPESTDPESSDPESHGGV